MTVVEESDTSVTMHTAFPGLYLTYDTAGHLLVTETEAERKAGKKDLVEQGKHREFRGEMGSSDHFQKPPVEDDDDSIPF